MTLQDELEGKTQWTKVSQQELDSILERHALFVDGQHNGERMQLGMHDLSYLDMAGRDLSRAELTGAVMSHCNLEGAKLNDAILFAADLRFCNMVGAELNHAYLRGAALAGADLSGAMMNDVDMRDGVLLRSAAEGGDMTPLVHDDANPGMEQTILKGADLTRAKVSANLIVQTDLTDCILKNASFNGANLSMSNLTGCDLEGADFTDANLATNDQMNDSPSDDAGNDIGNYCTWNPLSAINAPGYTLSNGNLDALADGDGQDGMAGTMFVSSGKWYFEFTIVNDTSSDVSVGVVSDTVVSSGDMIDGTQASGFNLYGGSGTAYGYRADGDKIDITMA